MTKAKAMSMLKENARYLIDPKFASKIAQAFNLTLKDLGMKAIPTQQYGRVSYTEETAKLPSIATYQLAENICLKITGTTVSSNKFGRGSYAQDITYKAVSILENSK